METMIHSICSAEHARAKQVTALERSLNCAMPCNVKPALIRPWGNTLNQRMPYTCVHGAQHVQKFMHRATEVNLAVQDRLSIDRLFCKDSVEPLQHNKGILKHPRSFSDI